MKPIRLSTIFAILFGVAISQLAQSAAGQQQLDKYGGTIAVKGTATGFFHIEEIEGRSWFITPEGNAFFAVALSHTFSGESNVACQNIYDGDSDAWLKGSFEKARKMGFNCALGSATSPERNLNGFVDVEKAEKLFRDANFPFAVGVILLKHPWEFVDGETMPDIFHPDYEQLIKTRAAEVCSQYKDDPLCMGYYYGFGAFNKSDEWVNHHFALPAGSPGREVLSNLLIKRYDNDVARFNKVYGTSLKDMSEMKSTFELTYKKEFERRNYPRIGKSLNPEKLADFEAIVSHMCVSLYELGHQSIRRWDKNHLILGSFIKEWALSVESWKKAAPFVDMLAPQHVNEFISVNEIAKATNLPIIFSDEYFGFHYPGKTGSLHAGLVSHDARSEVYQANLMRHFKDPQVMGVTYCACMYDQGGNTLAKNIQNGFYSLDGQPRKKLIDAVTEMNQSIYQHATKPASPNELKKLNTELFEKWDEHKVRRGQGQKQSGKTIKATGYVRVQQIDGVWWFIGPQGNKFVSLGVNHIEPHLWLAPYNKAATLKRYGDDMVGSDGHFNSNGPAAKKWIDAQVKTTKQLGFNTFGKHTHPTIDPKLYQDQIYYIASLDTAPLAGWQQRRGRGPRPDVFSVDFYNFVESRVKEVTETHKAQSNLIGYLYTDVPSWVMGRAEQKERNNATMIYPWINAILALGESSPGKLKWLEHLRQRYPSAKAAAETWGMPISPTYGISWAEMARQIDWSNPTDAAMAKKDMAAFMPIIAKQWYSMHEALIRKHDSNHLILGDKNMVMWHYDFTLPAIKEHVDVVCVQAYGPWEKDKVLTDKIYEATGKPIFNGDGCFGYAGPQQQKWGVKGFRTGSKSLAEAASKYDEMLRGMMSTPYYIGWHHCGYIEQWDESERGDAPRNENGFLDPMENLRTEWARTLRGINPTSKKLHEAAEK